MGRPFFYVKPSDKFTWLFTSFNFRSNFSEGIYLKVFYIILYLQHNYTTKPLNGYGLYPMRYKEPTHSVAAAADTTYIGGIFYAHQ